MSSQSDELRAIRDQDPDAYFDALLGIKRELEVAAVIIQRAGAARLVDIPGYEEAFGDNPPPILDLLDQHPDWTDEQVADEILVACDLAWARAGESP